MTTAFALTKPCPLCPFRTDIRPYLRKDRIDEIQYGLVRGEFPCHNTVTYDDGGEPVRTQNEAHCAGALILLEKMGRSSQMMRIAERLRIYDRRKLDMTAPVFNNFREMRKAQTK